MVCGEYGTDALFLPTSRRVGTLAAQPGVGHGVRLKKVHKHTTTGVCCATQAASGPPRGWQ